jgi:hypothetical protein
MRTILSNGDKYLMRMLLIIGIDQNVIDLAGAAV